MPVRSDPRLGEQIDEDANIEVNFTPSSASRSIDGVWTLCAP
jgi:hypothetical protein